MNDPSKKCFIISPIGERDSTTRKHADKVLKNLIEPALRELELKPIRADQIDQPGIISRQMFDELFNDRLCIALLTEANPNVLYEVAVAQCASRPLVLLIQEGTVAPFDLQGHRAVQYNFDVEEIKKSKEKLVAFSREALEKPLNPLVSFGFPKMHEEPIRQSFETCIFDIHQEFAPEGIFDLWKEDQDTDVPKKNYLLQIGLQKLVYASSKIGPGPVESVNLWVCHAIDKKGRPTLLRSGMGQGYFPFQQLLTKVAVKRSVYFRPIRVEYDGVQNLSVAAKVVLKGEPEIQGVEDWRFESITERKLGTKAILGIPVHSNILEKKGLARLVILYVSRWIISERFPKPFGRRFLSAHAKFSRTSVN